MAEVMAAAPPKSESEALEPCTPGESCVDARVTLDVGGTIMRTWRSTLTRRSAYFEALFSERFRRPDMHGEPVFVDCDPKVFEYVLDYFRGGRLLAGAPLEAVWSAAKRYAVDDLAELAQEKSLALSVVGTWRALKSEDSDSKFVISATSPWSTKERMPTLSIAWGELSDFLDSEADSVFFGPGFIDLRYLPALPSGDIEEGESEVELSDAESAEHPGSNSGTDYQSPYFWAEIRSSTKENKLFLSIEVMGNAASGGAVALHLSVAVQESTTGSLPKRSCSGKSGAETREFHNSLDWTYQGTFVRSL